MESLKSCWQCITNCFCRGSKSETGLLFCHRDDPGGMGQMYTVRRISSFGRDILNKDDDTEDVVFDSNESPIRGPGTLSVPWTSKAVPIQTLLTSEPFCLEITEEKWENYEETFPKIDSKKIASPATKQRGRWTKALGKVKKRDSANKSKHGLINESKSVGNGKNLSEISLEDCTPSVKTNTSRLSCKDIGPPITVSTPDLLQHKSPTNSQKCLAASSVELRSIGDASTLTVGTNSWMKSQSMQDVKSVSEMDISTTDRDRDREQIAKAYGLDLSLYPNLAPTKSSEALHRAWKSLDVLGKDDIMQEIPSGTVYFNVQFDSSAKKLEVYVERLRLCGKGKESLTYNTILKLTILPGDKYHKISDVLPRTLEPIVDVKFKFPVTDLTGKILRISVYDEEWQGMYDAIGHALFYLVDVNTHKNKSHQMKLYKQSIPDVIPGSLQVTLGYQEDKKMLSIIVIQAHNLTVKQPKGKGKYKTYIKIVYYSSGKVVKEKQSPVIISGVDTSYNYSVNLKIDPSGINNSYVVIKLKERHLLQDKTIGRLILGPNFYFNSKGNLNFTPWGRAILNKEIVSHYYRLYL